MCDNLITQSPTGCVWRSGSLQPSSASFFGTGAQCRCTTAPMFHFLAQKSRNKLKSEHFNIPRIFVRSSWLDISLFPFSIESIQLQLQKPKTVQVIWVESPAAIVMTALKSCLPSSCLFSELLDLLSTWSPLPHFKCDSSVEIAFYLLGDKLTQWLADSGRCSDVEPGVEHPSLHTPTDAAITLTATENAGFDLHHRDGLMSFYSWCHVLLPCLRPGYPPNLRRAHTLRLNENNEN